MNIIFMIVRDLLLYIAKITGLSYNEINIITYYYIIPFFYLTLIDYKLDTHILKTSFLPYKRKMMKTIPFIFTFAAFSVLVTGCMATCGG